MKFSALLSSLVSAAVVAASPLAGRQSQPLGIDVSSYQPNIDWNSVVNTGVSFVYIKATEGTSYTSSTFSSQYNGATNAGLIRGSYHFARPDVSSGAAQAEFFVNNGGGWSSDDNPYGATCYGLSHSSMVNWVADFSNTYNSLTGRYPVIYTTTDWWTTCTGNNGGFGSNNPLWLARYGSSPGTIPNGWGYETFWQYTDNASPNPGDGDYFNGDANGLSSLALGY